MARKLLTVFLAAQDVVEYFEHLMQLLARAERGGGGRLGPLSAGSSTPDAFSFRLERRVQVAVRLSDYHRSIDLC